MDNNNTGNNVGMVGMQQPVGDSGINNGIPVGVPDVVQNIPNEVTPNIVANPVPEVVDNSNVAIVNNVVDNSSVSVPVVDTNVISNQMGVDVNNNALNQNVAAPNVVSMDNNIGLDTANQVANNEVNVATPVAEGLATTDSVIGQQGSLVMDETIQNDNQTIAASTGVVTDNISVQEQNNPVNGETQTNGNTVDNSEIVSNDIVSLADYLGYLFLFSIPVLGIIMMIVKMGNKNNKNIANFAKAMLLYFVIFGVIFGGIGAFAYSTNPTVFGGSDNATPSQTTNDYSSNNTSNVDDSSVYETSDSDTIDSVNENSEDTTDGTSASGDTTNASDSSTSDGNNSSTSDTNS